jgi:hypothetical protein
LSFIAAFARSGMTAHSQKHDPPENYVIGALSESVKLMAGLVLQWFSAVRTRLRWPLDLLLEFIVLRRQLAVLQRTSTRRPCFRPSERLFWVLLVTRVGKLTAQFDHRPARHGFALASSRPLRNLGIRLMRPLARRTPQDHQ